MLNNKKVKVLKRNMYKELNTLSKEDLINMLIQSDITLKSMINDHINTVEKYEEDIDQLTNNYFELLSKLIKEEDKHNKASHHINNLLKFIKELKKDINYYQWRTKNLNDDVKDLREEIKEKNKTIIKLNDSNIRLDIDNNELQIQINELRNQIEENDKEHDKDLNKIQVRILNNIKAFLKYYKGTYDGMSRIRSIEKLADKLIHTVDMMELYKNKINSADRLERRAKEEIINQIIDDIKDDIKRHKDGVIGDIEEEIILEYDEDMELYM